MDSPRYTVKYLRLSLEDENEGESGSISSQRSILDAWLRRNPDAVTGEVLELTDDGFSGTGFQRPGMVRLLDLVRKGQVNCILVKDLSRFGRNYKEAGRLLEQVFPALGVRFVSVTDGYDSAACAPGGIGTALNNVLHDLYSRDISQKVRSSRHVMALRGLCLSPRAPFGYRKSPDDPHVLIPDIPAANTVRLLFQQAVSGRSPVEIARFLNETGVPTPRQYFRSKNEGTPDASTSPEFWSNDRVRDILRNPVYTGAIVHGKQKVTRTGSGKRRKTDPSEWIVTTGCHEPLISQEDFDAARESISRSASRTCSPDPDNLFPGRIRCSGCGRALRRSRGAAVSYFCRTPKLTASPECLSGRIVETDLRDAVARTLRMLLLTAADLQNLKTQCRLKEEQDAAPLRKSLHILRRQIRQGKADLLALAEQWMDSAISRETYLHVRQELQGQIASWEEQADTLQKTLSQEADSASPLSALLRSLEQKTDPDPEILTRRVVRTLISSIQVRSPDSISIHWRCFSPFSLYACQNSPE